MAVTIKDVARVAGVSPSTVCRALSTPELVRHETCERVRRAATDLGYSPNRAARGLITGRTGNIGLIVPDLGNPFFPGVVKGIQARAREADYAVFLADTDEDPAAETHLVRTLAKQVDGILLCSPRMSEADLRGFAAQGPLVMINRRVGRIPAITFANGDGMRQAVTHLTALGHRRIAYVAGPRTSWSNRERTRGLRNATAAAGAELVEIGHVQPQFDGGVAAADPVLAAGVTAVVAYNDVIALGLLSRFNSRGIAVPGTISVIGFDDIALSAMVHPSLTTVGLPMESCGRAGVDLLLGVLQDPQRFAASRRELGTQLMVRASTGPPPSA
jgi:DNA-binding LacI/PurR family transcriptional regulator